MVGMVVVAHGMLAQEIIKTTSTIEGRPVERALAVEIDALEDPAAVAKRIDHAVRAVDDGDGVLILTDMFGGTPSNVALSLLAEGRIEVVSGLNLPMMMYLAHHRDGLSLAELARSIIEVGREHISLASEFLNDGAR